MPRFTFEAIDRNGGRVRGAIDAQTQSIALDRLLASGQTPVALCAASSGQGLRPRDWVLRFRAFDYALMLRELGMLLTAGLPLERALIVLKSLAPNAAQSLRMHQILELVRGGDSLSQAFAQTVSEAPAYVPRLIAAGELSGRLPLVVVRLANGLARAKSLRDKVLLSLTYPAVLVITMAIVLYVVFTSVLPRLTPMFKTAGAALPVATRALLGLGTFVQSYGLLVVLLLAGCSLAAVYAWRQPELRLAIDRVLMKSHALFGLPNSYEAARFCRNLQTLLEGGLSLDRALGAARDGASNSWFRARIEEVKQEVTNGNSLRAALAGSSAVPELVIEFAAVGEETGRLGPMIGEVADILDEDVEKRLNRIIGFILPIATLIMGGLVAGMMAGIVTGILAVNDLAR